MQGLWHTRVPFESLGVHVFPVMVAVPRAQNAFDEAGRPADAKAAEKLDQALRKFVAHVTHHYPIPQHSR